jgi:hypothetical protein
MNGSVAARHPTVFPKAAAVHEAPFRLIGKSPHYRPMLPAQVAFAVPKRYMRPRRGPQRHAAPHARGLPDEQARYYEPCVRPRPTVRMACSFIKGRSDHLGRDPAENIPALDRWMKEAWVTCCHFRMIALVKLYQYPISPLLPGACRYTPSCSVNTVCRPCERTAHGAVAGSP